MKIAFLQTQSQFDMLSPAQSSEASEDLKEREREAYYERNLTTFLDLLSASTELEGLIPQIRELASQRPERRSGERTVRRNRSGGNVTYERLAIWKIVEKESGYRNARVLSFCKFVIDLLQDPNLDESTREKFKEAVRFAIMLAK
jgi:hypothetical protein